MREMDSNCCVLCANYKVYLTYINNVNVSLSTLEGLSAYRGFNMGRGHCQNIKFLHLAPPTSANFDGGQQSVTP